MRYRMFVQRFLMAPPVEDWANIAAMLPSHGLCQSYYFNCEEEELGYYVRAILWAHHHTADDVLSGRTIMLVQKHIFKFEWENVGGWDCAGIEYQTGR